MEVLTLNKGMSRSYAVRDQKTVLIDAGMGVSEDQFRKSLDQKGIRTEDVSLIILTHAHSDHFESLSRLKKVTGAPVLCHKSAETYLLSGESPPLHGRTPLGRFMMKMMKSPLKNYNPVQADIVIDSEYTLNKFGVAGRIISTPGHSDCSLSVLLDSGDAITGDIFTAKGLFWGKKPSLSPFCADEKQFLRSAESLVQESFHTCYSGHGGPFKRKDIEALVQREMLSGA